MVSKGTSDVVRIIFLEGISTVSVQLPFTHKFVSPLSVTLTGVRTISAETGR